MRWLPLGQEAIVSQAWLVGQASRWPVLEVLGIFLLRRMHLFETVDILGVVEHKHSVSLSPHPFPCVWKNK